MISRFNSFPSTFLILSLCEKLSKLGLILIMVVCSLNRLLPWLDWSIVCVIIPTCSYQNRTLISLPFLEATFNISIIEVVLFCFTKKFNAKCFVFTIIPIVIWPLFIVYFSEASMKRVIAAFQKTFVIKVLLLNLNCFSLRGNDFLELWRIHFQTGYRRGF